MLVVEEGEAARRVDARARALDTMRARRDSQVLRRETPTELNTEELLQLTEGETLNELRKEKDSHGTYVDRLGEEYHGIPVLDSSVTVKENELGQLTGEADGVLIQDIEEDLPDTTPVLSDKETLEIAIQAEGDGNNRNNIKNIKNEHFIFMDDQDKARLVNRVSYYNGKKKPMYIIDLKNGEVLEHWNSLMTAECNDQHNKVTLYGGNKKMGKIEYGRQPYCLDFSVDKLNNCYMQNKYIRVVDNKQTEDTTYNETIYFPCDQGYDDEINGGYSPALDAFFYGTAIAKMFEEWYNKTVLKNLLAVRVHYGNNVANAFWQDGFVSLGDGDESSYPQTSLDTLGHEFGHAVVEQGSNLAYFAESGGLNEAFADIMGEAAEEYLSKSDMVVGADSEKTKPYFRSFESPEEDGNSIRRIDKMTRDLDPHYSSGIYRRIWYVLVREQKMKFRTAFNVFRYANKLYWHYRSSFFDASCGLLYAAMDLGIDLKPFLVAFEDVGLPKCEVSRHVDRLESKKHVFNVTVSPESQPVFVYSPPFWAESFTVEAKSQSDEKPITIEIFSGSWKDEEYDNATLLSSGDGDLFINVNNSLGMAGSAASGQNYGTAEDYHYTFYIKLSSNVSYTDVYLKADYNCSSNYTPETSYIEYYYKSECNLE